MIDGIHDFFCSFSLHEKPSTLGKPDGLKMSFVPILILLRGSHGWKDIRGHCLLAFGSMEKLA